MFKSVSAVVNLPQGFDVKKDYPAQWYEMKTAREGTKPEQWSAAANAEAAGWYPGVDYDALAHDYDFTLDADSPAWGAADAQFQALAGGGDTDNVVGIFSKVGAQLPEVTDPEDPDPTDPTDPEPTDPTDPEPTDPTDPTPTDPTDPEPTDPTDPAPTDPTDSAPTDPTDPEPTDPTDPAPTDPAEPAPTGPSESTDSEEQGSDDSQAPELSDDASGEHKAPLTMDNTPDQNGSSTGAALAVAGMLVLISGCAAVVVKTSRKKEKEE